jgi:SAM-dependent methyltransferase
MYKEDLSLICCPETAEVLHLFEVTATGADGEIIEGVIGTTSKSYPIRKGIPRFIDDVSYNESWDFKWRVLDGGCGLNYRILDKSDPAYSIHDIYDRNAHDGLAFKRMADGLVLDIGCGVGQYAVKSLLENNPRKLVAVDLTGGVDVFRKIVEEQYPHLLPKLLIVQASVFSMPFPKEQFDYVYSLGVLMHTGDTLKALAIACNQAKPGGDINAWIYCSEPVAYDAVESSRKPEILTLGNISKFVNRLRFPMFWIHLFRRLDHSTTLRIVRFFSSEDVFQLSKKRGFRWLRTLFPTVDHPDPNYRLINNYDGYVNNWCDTWSEHEIFPVLKSHSIAILGMSEWRLGIWGRKMADFYPSPDGGDSR